MANNLEDTFLELLENDYSIILDGTFIYSTGFDHSAIESLDPSDVLLELHGVMGDNGEFSMIIHKSDLNTLKLDEEGNTWSIDGFDAGGSETNFSIQFVETTIISTPPN